MFVSCVFEFELSFLFGMAELPRPWLWLVTACWLTPHTPSHNPASRRLANQEELLKAFGLMQEMRQQLPNVNMAGCMAARSQGHPLGSGHSPWPRHGADLGPTMAPLARRGTGPKA